MDSKMLSNLDNALIHEEETLHEKVKSAVRSAALDSGPDMAQVNSRLVELRNEAISASERDLPSLFQQMYTQHSLAARDFKRRLPEMRAPYFAHMKLQEKGKIRDILIGQQTFIDSKAGVTIIDWRQATLAKIFFNFREGEEYEIELPGRIAQGVLLARRVITFDVGELVGISTPSLSYYRPKKTRMQGENSESLVSSEWKKVAGKSLPTLQGGAGSSLNIQSSGFSGLQRSQIKLPDISALLDKEQYAILTKSKSSNLLILGGAGSGKTTIALHRMAILHYNNPKKFNKSTMRVIVPEHGLVRLTERLLGGLGLDGTKVLTYDHWIADEGQHILKGIPKRICQYTPPQAIKIKRHPAMKKAVDLYVHHLEEMVLKLFDSLVTHNIPGLKELLAKSAIPLWNRIQDADHFFKSHAPKDPRTRDLWNQFIRESKDLVLDVQTARGILFSDLKFLEPVVKESHGEISIKSIEELRRHTHKQFLDPQQDKEMLSDFESNSELDGSKLEEDEFAGTIDVEDYSVLLYLMFRVHGKVVRKGKSLTVSHHLVIDEAQEFGPIELTLLGQSLSEQGCFSVAGDEAQQSDPGVLFESWDKSLTDLASGYFEQTRLKTNYRCPKPIADFGHQILGPYATREPLKSVRDGLPVTFSSFPNIGLVVISICDVLSELIAKEPTASIGIICENEDKAKIIFDSLSNIEDVRFVNDGEFSFTPGIDVTFVSQVKGLEFDYVILPDVSISQYPDTAVARRTLYIAITRAIHQLWVISEGRKSPIIEDYPKTSA